MQIMKTDEKKGLKIVDPLELKIFSDFREWATFIYGQPSLHTTSKTVLPISICFKPSSCVSQ